MPTRNSATPGTTIATRHSSVSPTPNISAPASTNGIAICVTPPPMLPQPAVVAFAVPITFDENITEVWYCVITKEAPITPIASLNSRKVS